MDLSSLSLPTDPPPFPPSVPLPPVLPPHATTVATIANPGPPTVNSSHPPYAEMIYAAITALKERNGSSRRAIANYIESTYSNLPAAHSALLTHHLKRLKNSGQLVMVKKSYKIPRSYASSTLPPTATTDGPQTGPSRGRGRPRKSSTEPMLVALGLVDQPKRGPGRPRKSGGPELGQNVPMKRRGRPPKNGPAGSSLPKTKRPGRPRKTKTLMNGVNGVSRVASVPARAQTQAQAQAQIQAQTQALDQPNLVVPTTNIEGNMLPVHVSKIPRPRGRPRKDGSKPITHTVSRRQQRQVPKKPKTSTGRPVGRPKKIAGAAAEQQELVIAELKRKLEFVQSKVKHVVDVLKPHITSETQINVVAAIQDLEEVASVDLINTSFKEDVQPPPNIVLQN